MPICKTASEVDEKREREKHKYLTLFAENVGALLKTSARARMVSRYAPLFCDGDHDYTAARAIYFISEQSLFRPGRIYILH